MPNATQIFTIWDNFLSMFALIATKKTTMPIPKTSIVLYFPKLASALGLAYSNRHENRKRIQQEWRIFCLVSLQLTQYKDKSK